MYLYSLYHVNGKRKVVKKERKKEKKKEKNPNNPSKNHRIIEC